MITKEEVICLLQGINIIHFSWHDESHKHVGHAGAKDGGGHFRALIVADDFVGMKAIQRHRLVNSYLKKMFLTKKIHALSLELFTAAEFQERK